MELPVTEKAKAVDDTRGKSNAMPDSPVNEPTLTQEGVHVQVEEKSASVWSNASLNSPDSQNRVGLEKRSSALKDQIEAMRRDFVANESVQSGIQSAEKQIKELADQIKSLEGKVDLQSISSLAGKALDTLDSKLEVVEQKAGMLMNSFTSFFSSVISIDLPASTVETSESKAESTFSAPAVPGAAYGTSRLDNELFNLHTSEAIYLDTTKDLEVIDVGQKTGEIEHLLSEYKETLEPLMNRLVPTRISYEKFWSTYFTYDAEIREADKARRELLLVSDTDLMNDTSTKAVRPEIVEEDDEDFTWDDDEVVDVKAV